jgi:hypothetical protein
LPRYRELIDAILSIDFALHIVRDTACLVL